MTKPRQSDARLLEKHRKAADADPLGPSPDGQTISGAAYRGQEMAGREGHSRPAEPGFGSRWGLGYAEVGEESDSHYQPSQETPFQEPRN